MIFVLFLVALAAPSLCDKVKKEISLKVDHRVHTYRLIPDNYQSPSITKWSLKGTHGSKLIITCRTEGEDCSAVNVMAREGERVANLCWEWADERMVLDGNEGSVEIDTNGTPYKVYCNVTSTRSYLYDKEESLETAEDGMVGKKPPSCPCGWANKESGRIVGGKETGKHEFPFVVLVGERGAKRPDCGGSIITRFHVLTAAHCTENREELIEVTIGEHKISAKSETTATQVIKAKKVINHKNYDSSTMQFDISLILLETPLKFSKLVGPLCMPKQNVTAVGEYVKVMGWGKLQYGHREPSDVLMKANLRVVHPDICKKIYPNNIVPGKDTQFCTYHSNKDSCSGDSGGPVTWLNPETNMFVQAALVSFGNRCNTTDPAVNTNVYFFMDWIKEKIKETNDQQLCY